MKKAHIKIVIVGRPNVGKSSLFNRIVGSRKAIVESASGTTRDRLHADIKWKSKSFTIIDTGGFEPTKPGDMAKLILRQLNVAIEEADVVFFMTDITAGVVAHDMEFASRLRKTSKPIYLVVNKADDVSRASRSAEFYELGLGEPYAVSAMNGTGIDRLLDDAVKRAAKPAAETPAPSASAAVKVAIVGRPNVGKSSFLNAVLREERVIVHPTAGTTRDSIDTDFEYKGRDYILIDTAGMRHNAKIAESADFYGSVRSKEAIRRADIAIVMVDGFDGMREDDRRIAEFVMDEGKGLILAVNKWDLVNSVEIAKYAEMLIQKMRRLKDYPIVFISSLTRKNALACLDAAWAVYERSKIAMTPAELKELRKALNDAAEIKTKRVHFLYCAQESSQPPTFAFGVKRASAVAENLKRYIENFLRARYDLLGVPVRIQYIQKQH